MGCVVLIWSVLEGLASVERLTLCADKAGALLLCEALNGGFAVVACLAGTAIDPELLLEIARFAFGIAEILECSAAGCNGFFEGLFDLLA